MRAENSKYPHLGQFELNLLNLLRVFIKKGLRKKRGEVGFLFYLRALNYS